jgi:hypothetical protein
MTLPANQNAPYSVYATKESHCGFEYRQLKRAGNVAIYQQTRKGRSPAFSSYEVVILRPYKAWESFGRFFPAGERYPKSEDWGLYGFTYRTIEEAERKFAELTGKVKEVA